jgi:hypothetical protein
LLKKHKKIAVWGVTFHSITLFKNELIFQGVNIVAVDNSSAKQMMNLYGKKIYAPSVIGEKNISTVIVFYPNSLQQISAQIQKLYPCAVRIIDACDLIQCFKE